MTDLLLRLVGEDAASSSLQSVKHALHNVVNAAQGAVKAFEEAAQADRRLARVAGESTSALQAQASALQETLGVSEELTKSIQTMLLTYGQAPEGVAATTAAILDFAAATGEDAVSATHRLIQGVDTGKQTFREYGVLMEAATGKSAGLAAATAALADKFGGAGGDEANSLTGKIRRSKAALGEFEEAAGGAIVKLEQHFALFEKWTRAVEWLSGAQTEKRLEAERGRNKSEEVLSLAQEIKSLQEFQSSPMFGAKDQIALDEAHARYNELTGAGRARPPPRVDQPTSRAAAAASSPGSGSASAGHQVLGDDADAAVREHNAAQAWAAEHEWANWGDVTSARAASEKAKKAMERSAAETVSLVRQAGEARREELVRQVDESGQMGDQIGAALVNAFGAQLQRLAKGGEMDAGELLSSILGSAVSVLGGVLGMLFPGAGALIGAVTSVVGGLGQAGVSAAFAKRHTGGWAGAPRFHGGGWPGVGEVPAVLQSGERVLSRSEVAAMGGGAAVDSAARGGGQGLTVAMNVSTFDGRSMREFFEDRGGRGLAQAIRSGRSGLTPALAR